MKVGLSVNRTSSSLDFPGPEPLTDILPYSIWNTSLLFSGSSLVVCNEDLRFDTRLPIRPVRVLLWPPAHHLLLPGVIQATRHEIPHHTLR